MDYISKCTSSERWPILKLIFINYTKYLFYDNSHRINLKAKPVSNSTAALISQFEFDMDIPIGLFNWNY